MKATHGTGRVTFSSGHGLMNEHYWTSWQDRLLDEGNISPNRQWNAAVVALKALRRSSDRA
jgi:hypothetical protein